MSSAPVSVQHPSAPPLPIVIDSPHSGTDHPADFGARLMAGGPICDRRLPVAEVQVEVKRSLYMDSAYQPNAGFARLQAALDAMLGALAEHARAVLAR